MNPNPNPQRLRHEQKCEVEQTVQEVAKTEAREFSSAEEALRLDASQTTTPPSVERRLVESILKEGGSTNPKPWWKRWFGGS